MYCFFLLRKKLIVAVVLSKREKTGKENVKGRLVFEAKPFKFVFIFFYINLFIYSFVLVKI
jgi:hypothetical protein